MSGRVLVTGATGFVGRALCAALVTAGRPVVALVRQQDARLPAQVAQRVAQPIETLDEAGWRAMLSGVDQVVHLAGIAHIGKDVPDQRYDAVNHLATRRLAAAAVASGVKWLVFASSIRAQTGAVATSVLNESSAPMPTDAYGRSKLAAENAIRQCGVAHTILRPVLIAGPEAKGNLALLLRLAQSGLPLPFARLQARRSLVSQADVVALCIRALDDPAMRDRTFIAADRVPVTLADMLSAMRAGLGMSPRLFSLPEALLALPFKLTGRADMWQRIAGELVVDPKALAGLGYQWQQTGLEALTTLAASAVRARQTRE